ncbi:NUDIX hydrolase [Bacillus sp. DJP31]|uniref:NUDIX hydrolase n=1 Tax=Bacillus sp. DJP31 TaxID=3409789 RepID=UPI003BB6F92E
MKHFNVGCLLSRNDDRTYIYFQLRSNSKKDFPNLLDITAAGHLLSHETIYEGIREVEEELGIGVTFNDLVSLGIIKNSIKHADFIDNEFCHVFLLEANLTMEEFKPQVEEVAGILKAEFNHFSDLWSGKRNEIRVEGFVLDKAGERVLIDKFVERRHFVPYEETYFQVVIEKISEKV